MSIPILSLRHQGAPISGLFKVILRPSGGTLVTPGPVHEAVVPARSPALLAAFRSWCQHPDDGHLPAHLFPQWGLALTAQALLGSPYPMRRILNQGFKMTRRGPLRGGRVAAELRLSPLPAIGCGEQ